VAVGEYVTGGENLSADLIRQGEGQIGLEEIGVRLAALPPDILGPDESLSTASAQLINEHLESSADALLLAQVKMTIANNIQTVASPPIIWDLNVEY